MVKIIFSVCTGLEIITLSILVAGWISERCRIYPSGDDHPRGTAILSCLFFSISLQIITLGVLDWQSSDLPCWLRVIGAVGWTGGISLAGLALHGLGWKVSFGEQAIVTESGLYRYSRNPQYLGFLIGLVGWGFFTSSYFTLITCALAILPLVIVPRVEELWLKETYGAVYQHYQSRVPRWLSVKLKGR
jgi:protein-S-isoprenylcysteine O-methyltransferase Ste14